MKSWLAMALDLRGKVENMLRKNRLFTSGRKRRKLYVGADEWHKLVVYKELILHAEDFIVYLVLWSYVWKKWVFGSGDFNKLLLFYVVTIFLSLVEPLVSYHLKWKWKIKQGTICLSWKDKFWLCAPCVMGIMWVVVYTAESMLQNDRRVLITGILLFVACFAYGIYQRYVAVGDKVWEYVISARKIPSEGDVAADGGIKIKRMCDVSYKLDLLQENLFICDNGDLLIIRGDTLDSDYEADPLVIPKEDVKKIVIRRKGMPTEVFKYQDGWVRAK